MKNLDFSEISSLRGLTIDVSDPAEQTKVVNEALELRDKILQGQSTRGRNKDQIFQNCFNGLIAEHAIIKTLGFEKSPDMAYDLFKDDCKLEIKCTTKNSKYWNITNSYNFFLQNAHQIDYIILTHLDLHNKTVTPLKAIKAEFFESAMTPSYYNNGYYIKESILKNNILILN